MEDYLTSPTEGPRLRPAIGLGSPAGVYTEIEAIIAPSEAAAGDLVTVEVRVRNIWTGPFFIGITGHYPGVDAFFSPDYALVEPGQISSFTYSFTMPDNGITFGVWSFFWTGEEWSQDDYDSIEIILPPEEEMEVSVSLRNPPAEGDKWQLRISNASKTETRFIEDLPIAGAANFTDVPPDWDLPLCIDLTVYHLEPPDTWQQIYHIQSIWPDREEYSPDVVIPSLGSFNFNFLTESFEGVVERAGCLPVVIGLALGVVILALGIVAIIGGI